MGPNLVEDRYTREGGPDFAKLGAADQALQAVLRPAGKGGRMTVDWKDEEAIR